MSQIKYRLFWWRESRYYNFGDEITPWLFKKMFGIYQNEPCNIKETNVLLSVGSIMRLCDSNTEVWGSGIRNIDQSDFKPARKYHAVRGLFSRNQLLNLGMDCPAIYGDPALLIPKYYLPKNITKKYKLGIIPHAMEYEEIKQKYSCVRDVPIIDLRTNDIQKTIDSILECEHTISTSLHGLIISIIYSIPTRWMIYSDKIKGDGIKYYDFFSSLDSNVFESFDRKHKISLIPQYNPIIYKANLNIKTLIENTIKYDISKINLDLLQQSCPIKI